MRSPRLRQLVSERMAVLGAGIAATSWAAIFVRLADEAPALTIAAYRMVLAAGFLVIIAAVGVIRGKDGLPPKRAWFLLGLSGVFLAGHFWAWFASLERTSVGSSVVIVAMQPLLGAFLAYLFLAERPTRNEYYGIGLAAVGLIIISGNDFASSSTEFAGDALALLGGFFAAGYQTIGRKQRAETSATVYSASVYVVAAAVLWALVAVTQPETGGFEADTWTFLVLLAVVPQVMGHTAFNWALGHFRVVTVSIAHLGEPLFATLLAIAILSEEPEPGVIVGAPLILGGLVMGLRREKEYPEIRA